MLEKGLTKTPYEPYKLSTTAIPLQNNFIGKLPNGIKDELTIDNYGNVSLLKKVGKVVLDGSENWAIDGALTDTTRFKIPTSEFSGSIGQSYTQHTISNWTRF